MSRKAGRILTLLVIVMAAASMAVRAEDNFLVVHVNQVGYHSDSEKWAITEEEGYPLNTAYLQIKSGNNWKSIKTLSRKKYVAKGGRHYQRFDFSSVDDLGTYRIKYRTVYSPPFRIAKDVFKQLYKDTLTFFFPSQMCHIQVNLGGPVHHKACHMDDALQVRPNKTGPDGYSSYGANSTARQVGSRVPVTAGGWHDAGDYDLNVASNAFTLLLMSWAYEDFKANLDVTTLNSTTRQFIRKNNKMPDILEQIAWSARWMLQMKGGDGRVYIGVVAPSQHLYGLAEKPDLMTDQQNGTYDDREVYTVVSAANQLKYAAAMAAVSRALESKMPDLSKKALTAAESAYRYFQNHRNTWVQTPYNRCPECWQEDMRTAAAIELYLATGKKKYKNSALAGKKSLENVYVGSRRYMESTINWYALPHAIRAVDQFPEIREYAEKGAKRWRKVFGSFEDASIFGVDDAYEDTSWGIIGQNLGMAIIHYMIEHYLPETSDEQVGIRYLNYITGLHPGPNYSFIVGKGAITPRYQHSAFLEGAYGKAPGSIKGAVVTGIRPTNIPGLMEYDDRRDYYYGNEATIAINSIYLYVSLAAEGNWKKKK